MIAATMADAQATAHAIVQDLQSGETAEVHTRENDDVAELLRNRGVTVRGAGLAVRVRSPAHSRCCCDARLSILLAGSGSKLARLWR